MISGGYVEPDADLERGPIHVSVLRWLQMPDKFMYRHSVSWVPLQQAQNAIGGPGNAYDRSRAIGRQWARRLVVNALAVRRIQAKLAQIHTVG